MTDQEARDKILNRIQKCLRLSKSSEPHEAAAAMRQAQKMMQAHSVSDAEIMGLEVKSAIAITKAPAMRKCPLGFAHLVNIVQVAFGVTAVMETEYVNGKPRLAFRYFGIAGRPELAVYAHHVIERQLWASWNAHRHNVPELNNVRGARMGFWVGWLQRVRQQVIDFGCTDKEKELVSKHKALYYKSGLTQTKGNTMKLNGSMVASGHAAAGDFSLHRPMNGATKAQLQLA